VLSICTSIPLEHPLCLFHSPAASSSIFITILSFSQECARIMLLLWQNFPISSFQAAQRWLLQTSLHSMESCLGQSPSTGFPKASTSRDLVVHLGPWSTYQQGFISSKGEQGHSLSKPSSRYMVITAVRWSGDNRGSGEGGLGWEPLSPSGLKAAKLLPLPPLQSMTHCLFTRYTSFPLQKKKSESSRRSTGSMKLPFSGVLPMVGGTTLLSSWSTACHWRERVRQI
jgi:hypothetical protein